MFLLSSLFLFLVTGPVAAQLPAETHLTTLAEFGRDIGNCNQEIIKKHTQIPVNLVALDAIAYQRNNTTPGKKKRSSLLANTLPYSLKLHYSAIPISYLLCLLTYYYCCCYVGMCVTFYFLASNCKT
jgi:hypothetical protein